MKAGIAVVLVVVFVWLTANMMFLAAGILVLIGFACGMSALLLRWTQNLATQIVYGEAQQKN